MLSDDEIPDERLELIFTCCHPALALDAQVALTLRTLGGLETDEIARAFLVPEPTMAKRLVRAQAQDQGGGHPVPRAAGAPAARPARRRARGRLPDLQRGLRRPRRPRRRGDPARPLARRADAGRAARCTRLLALMLVNDARRDARFADGTVVLLRDQDRVALGPRPDRAGTADARPGASPSADAATTCCRRRSPSLHLDDPPDWPQLAALYGELARLHRLAGRRAQPRRGAIARGRRRRGARSRSPTRSTSTATTTCTRPAPSCCAGSSAHDEARAAYARALELVHSDAGAPLPRASSGGAQLGPGVTSPLS